MQVEGTRMYRVKEVAEGLYVSVATIYRAIDSGVLPALKVGTGSGALRIPGVAVQAYMRACEQAARQAPVLPPETAEACAPAPASAAVAADGVGPASAAGAR
jgi:excisionase family DNA binding protein